MTTLGAGDVRIRADSDFWDNDRVHVSAGTEMTSEGQLVAVEPWRRPSADEIEALTAGDLFSDGQVIRVVGFPPGILEVARSLGITSITRQRDVNAVAISHSGDYLAMLRDLRSTGRTLLASSDGFNMQSIRCESTLDLRSATYDEKDRRYVGLHVDDWDHLTTDRRHGGRQRLVLNLGAEDRYFVFCHHSVGSGLGGDGVDDRQVDDVPRHLSRHDRYPVVRLSIRPGEAYIAPIQAVFHDGTTVGRTTADISLSMIGYFR